MKCLISLRSRLCGTIEVRSHGCIGIGPSSVGLNGDRGGPGVEEGLGGSTTKTFWGKVSGIGDAIRGQERPEVFGHSESGVMNGNVLSGLEEEDIDGVTFECIHTSVA